MATTTDVTTYNNYIDGQWVPTLGGAVFENRNPARSDDLIGLFQRSTARDVDAAVDAATRAYERWRLVPAPRRAEILFRAAQMLVARKDRFAREMTREMGKVLSETGGDVQEAIDMTFFMAGEGRRQYGQTVPSELRNKFAMSVRQPLGVCAIVTPWNFPMAIPSWKIMPALVCGNTVVFKPATDTPALGERFVELLAEAGIPPGVVNIVHGGGGAVGDRLVRHPDVPVITLTGSRETGVAVLKAAADNLKHVHHELGGKNAIIVMDDADLDLAAEGII
ncbi:MAG: aldehyde dehydrogenase family protein, partial [Acidobacteria bacterium]|nr:aldehyde dehydrogenase family protein [Acidobacteriota bacterium]